MGWNLPDGGRAVKALADAAPGGAFNPRELEKLPANSLGYRAKWHVVRYKFYGLDWDITGLQLTPNKPEPGLPTLAIINGGSANLYEFFVDLLNRPGLGQYLAQRMPVMIITIPLPYETANGMQQIRRMLSGSVRYDPGRACSICRTDSHVRLQSIR
jgi:hypothetical protein